MKQNQRFRFPRKKNPIAKFVEKRALQSCKHDTPKNITHSDEARKNLSVHVVIGRPMEFNINYN